MICLYVPIQLIKCQIDSRSEKFKLVSIKYFNGVDSINLPNDFIGPKYFYYEEGSIIDFYFPDSSSVEVLCGADAIISPDSSFISIDSTIINKRIITIRYFNKTKRLYARQDFLPNFDILYQNASLQRSLEFDKVFELLKMRKLK
jgi:hypothetical protein